MNIFDESGNTGFELDLVQQFAESSANGLHDNYKRFLDDDGRLFWDVQFPLVGEMGGRVEDSRYHEELFLRFLGAIGAETIELPDGSEEVRTSDNIRIDFRYINHTWTGQPLQLVVDLCKVIPMGPADSA
jgi:hypothetical protein